MLLGLGVLFSLGALVTVMIAPQHLQLVLSVDSVGANQVVVPVAYWCAAAVWAWLSMRMLNVPVARGVVAAIAIALSLQILLLTATFASQLPDASAFSTRFYRVYARLFSAAVLAGGLWWSIEICRRLRQQIASPASMELPIVAGAVVLLTRLMRYDAAIAVVGVALAAAMLIASHRDLAVKASAIVSRVVETEWPFLAMVFVAATALRVLYLQRVMTNPDYVETGGDGLIYDSLAWSIATGAGVPVAFRDAYPLLLLGYVRFVSVVYAIAGHSYFAIGVVQALIGAAACALLYVIGKSLFGRTVARVASVFAALSFPLIFAAAAIGHQAVDVFLTLLVTWLMMRSLGGEDGSPRPASLWLWSAIGVVMGCAIAVRETNAFLLAFVLGWIAVVFRRASIVARMRAIAVVAAGVAVVTIPLLLPTVSSADGRLRLRQHFDRLYQGQGDAVRTRKDLVGPLADPGAALTQFREQPGRVAGTLAQAMVHNFALQFFTQPFGGFDLVFLAKGSAYYYGQWFNAYALAAAGLVVAMRQAMAGGRRAIGIALVIGVIVSRTIPHLVLESHYRHRVPIEPFLILLAAVAAVGLVRAAREWHDAPARLQVTG